MTQKTATIRRVLTAALGTAILAGSALPAFAQIEEIVVTARKKEENLQRAPVAVSAVTAQAIEEKGISDVNDLAKFTTGLSFSQAFGRSTDRPVVRGQANVLAGVQFGVESGTAYFIDGVYFPGDLQALDLNEVSRVEVIKGPQSALYGRNTYAGAISFVTKEPGDTWSGSVKGQVAQFGEYELTGSIGGPVVQDKLWVRVNARHFEYGGEYTNTLTGKKVGNEKTDSFGLNVIWKPTDNLQVRWRSLYREDKDGPLALFLQPATANNCYPGFRSPFYRGGLGAVRTSTNTNQFYCGVIAPRPDLVALNTDALPNGTGDGTAYDGVETRESFNALNVSYDIGGSGYTITSLTGYRRNENLFGTDSDHSDGFLRLGAPTTEPLFANTNRNRTRDWSQEVRLASPTTNRWRAIVGAYWYEQKDDEYDLTYASPREGTYPLIHTETKNNAVFGLLAFDVTDQISVTGELRHANEDKVRREIASPVLTTYNRTVSFSSTTPRFTLDYKPDQDLLFYATYAKGTKPGGVNGTAGLTAGYPDYLQEESNNYELGAKTSWLDRRLILNGAIYRIDAKDVQLTTALPSGGAGAITSVATNQGGARINGLEIDGQAAVTENLSISAGYTWTDAKFTKGCDADYYTLLSGGFLKPVNYNGPLCNITGKRLPLGSEHMANFTATWEAPLNMASGLSYFLTGTYTYESTKYVQTDNFAETGATNLLGARAGLRSESGWSFTVFGRNLTDEDTIPLATRWFDIRHGLTALRLPAGVPTGVGGGIDTGTPRAFFGGLRKGRTFGAEFKYDF